MNDMYRERLIDTDEWATFEAVMEEIEGLQVQAQHPAGNENLRLATQLATSNMRLQEVSRSLRQFVNNRRM